MLLHTSFLYQYLGNIVKFTYQVQMLRLGKLNNLDHAINRPGTPPGVPERGEKTPFFGGEKN